MDEQLPNPLRCFLDEHLTAHDQRQIVDQIYGHSKRNRQVLWTGMAREHAQSWADKHDLQTLTTAMGPLMDNNDPRCPRHGKGDAGWKSYVHGASAIFAWYISKGDVVTVLTHPPPELFHPSGITSYQVIEEPIIKGMLKNRAVGRIELVHPSVPSASVTRYQYWPTNESNRWKPPSHARIPNIEWRSVKLSGPPLGFEVVCGLGGSRKAPSTRVHEPAVAENHLVEVENVLNERERHQLRCLEGEQSKARKELQQQQCHALKKLLEKNSEDEKSMQKMHEKKLSAVSSKKKKATRREELRQRCDKEARQLREEHGRLKLDLEKAHNKALDALKKSQAQKRNALKEKQKKKRQALKLKEERKAKLAQEKREAKLKEEQSRTKAHGKGEAKLKKKRGIKLTQPEETKWRDQRGAELQDTEHAMVGFERERTLNSGLDSRKVADLVRALIFSLLVAGFKYVVDSLIYLTQISSSGYETALGILE